MALVIFFFVYFALYTSTLHCSSIPSGPTVILLLQSYLFDRLSPSFALFPLSPGSGTV